MATTWITNLAMALRAGAMLALLGQGFAPADVLAMAGTDLMRPVTGVSGSSDQRATASVTSRPDEFSYDIAA